MQDLKQAAMLLRWTAQNTIHNLTFIPADRLHWKPGPTSKSALEIAGEMVAGQRMMLPVFQGGEWTQSPFPQPATLEEAKALLEESAEQYAVALEAARGPELERAVTVGGFPMWGPKVVLFPVIDAIHHHGQISYLQSLLGDTETHFDPEAGMKYFGPPQPGGG